MKIITKIIGLFILCGAFVGCTIVMPTPEPAKTKDPSYTRPTPTTTVVDTPPSTRPRPNRGDTTPAYTRPTPTTTVGASSPDYKRPVTSTTTNPESISASKKQGSDGRIDAPKGKEAIADSTVQARSRVRR